MKKSLPALPTAIIGIALLGLIVIGINALTASSRFGSQHLDLTENKIYTLSDGTKRILSKLDTPVTIRFYFTEGTRALPRQFNLYANRVRDFLSQYETLGNGKVKFESIDVQPFTDAEDQARLDGINSNEISADETLYLGVSVTCLDRKESIPQLDPTQESMLEYQISRAITQVVRSGKPKLGLMSGLPIQGNGMPQQMGGQPAWFIHQQLSADYELVTIAPDAKEIPPTISTLMVVHPSMISPETEFAIDQYLLKGGKAAIFLDSYHFFGQNQRPQNPMMQAPQTPTASTLPNLLKAWGINFESGLVVGDQKFRYSEGDRVCTGISQFSGEESIDNKDPVTAQLEDVLMILPGGFTGEPVVGLHKNSLVRSSSTTQLFDGAEASRFDQKLLTSTPVSNQGYDMVLRLFGRFPTAFPNGKPGATPPSAEAGKPDAQPAEAPALTQPTGEGAVVLFADVDMITDQGAFRANPLFPQYVMPVNGNFPVAMNALEQLAGDQNLIGARSRPSATRPFKVLDEMQSKAEQRFSTEIKNASATVNDLLEKQAKLNDNQSKKSGKYTLTKEMQETEEKLQKEIVEANKRLRDIRKNLTKEKDKLKSSLTWANILVVPLLVAIAGLSIALYRRSRTAAR